LHHREPDALRGTGHHRDLVRELEVHAAHPCWRAVQGTGRRIPQRLPHGSGHGWLGRARSWPGWLGFPPARSAVARRTYTCSMSEARTVKNVLRSRATVEGAGVHLHRAIGLGPPEEYDPFLLLDDFRSDDPDEYRPGFPWHPHRGMETITYVLRGRIEHRDSLGTRDVIAPGDLQWLTAGSGITRQEMPDSNDYIPTYHSQL